MEPFIDNDNNVWFDTSRPKCRRCKEELFGGEIHYGICDICDDGVEEID